jgi:hypothetical protein
MKTNKKVWATSLCAILLGITVYSGYHTYNKYQEINESLLTLRDVEAMAGGETGGANGKQYHKDNPLLLQNILIAISESQFPIGFLT